jgi:hypothetical protein
MAMIDTLKLARALRERGGFPPEAAEATADALNQAFGAEVAAKADIERLEITTKSEIERLEITTKSEIERLEITAKSEIERLEAGISRLDQRINHLEQRLSDGFANIDRRFTVLTWAVGIIAALEIVILSLLLRH